MNAEPLITINGVQLNRGQAMTLRVAANQFAAELRNPVHMKELGPIGPAYLERLSEILSLMHAIRR